MYLSLHHSRLMKLFFSLNSIDNYWDKFPCRQSLRSVCVWRGRLGECVGGQEGGRGGKTQRIHPDKIQDPGHRSVSRRQNHVSPTCRNRPWATGAVNIIQMLRYQPATFSVYYRRIMSSWYFSSIIHRGGNYFSATESTPNLQYIPTPRLFYVSQI